MVEKTLLMDRLEEEVIENDTDNQTRYICRTLALCADGIIEAINKNTEKVSELIELAKPLVLPVYTLRDTKYSLNEQEVMGMAKEYRKKGVKRQNSKGGWEWIEKDDMPEEQLNQRVADAINYGRQATEDISKIGEVIYNAFIGKYKEF